MHIRKACSLKAPSLKRREPFLANTAYKRISLIRNSTAFKGGTH